VRNAQIDRLKQDCFIYYLLLDADHASRSVLPNGNGHAEGSGGSGMELTRSDKGKGKAREDEGDRANEFARRRCLPLVWRGFMFGYWALDHELWDVSLLYPQEGDAPRRF
jgi:hypothetical protein